MSDNKTLIPKVPKFGLSELSRNRPKLPAIPEKPTAEQINQFQSAGVFMRAIAEEAMQWKEQLPENFKPAILAFLYGGIQIQVQTLSQVSFHGIRIEGMMNGSPCSLLAHQSTVQLLCFGEEIRPEVPQNPIGFIWENNSVEV